MAHLFSHFTKLVKSAALFSRFKPTFILNKIRSTSQKKYQNFRPTPVVFLSYLSGIAKKEKTNNTLDSVDEVVHNIALATIALKDGEAERSEKTFLRTLTLAENNNLHLSVIYICDVLSSLFMKIGDNEKAEDFLLQALDNLVKLGAPDDDNSVVGFNLKLSRVYSSNGNDELAELNFKNCMKLQKKKLEKCTDEDSFVMWMTILYWYGKFLIGKNRLQEAKLHLNDCYQTSSKVQNISKNQLMVILYNLGEICYSLGEYDEALKHFLRGISVGKKCKNPDLPYFYLKLGKITMCQKSYDDAKFWFEQGKRLAQNYYNSDAEKESNECLQKIQNVLEG